jgi:hypothetical protein
MRSLDYEMSGAMSYPMLDSRLLYIVDALSTSETQALLNTISDHDCVGSEGEVSRINVRGKSTPTFFVCVG